MIPAVEVGEARVFLGDCREILRGLADNSVDSVVTDPPYELGFMGKKWDSAGIAYDVTVWEECLRVLKPGGHILAFGGSRTFHRMAVAIEDAGFEIRDSIAWISSKTFPKSLNVRKAIDKAGVDGSAWEGWGTGLKNVVEPIVMGRKPLVGTVAANVLEHGVGGLNIDASRVAGNVPSVPQPKTGGGIFSGKGGRNGELSSAPSGRWPANVILDEYSAGLLDEQSGVSKVGGAGRSKDGAGGSFGGGQNSELNHYGDSGGASRFFYCAKASKRDRNEGLGEMEIVQGKRTHSGGEDTRGRPVPQNRNIHPTVKPTALMRYLIKLVTPPGGTVLDPFTGSGSTGKAALLDGYKFVGAELTEEYLPIIEGRLTWAQENTDTGTVHKL